jgi:hypothetical protein
LASFKVCWKILLQRYEEITRAGWAAAAQALMRAAWRAAM